MKFVCAPWQSSFLYCGRVMERELFFRLSNKPVVALHHPVPEDDTGAVRLIFK